MSSGGPSYKKGFYRFIIFMIIFGIEISLYSKGLLSGEKFLIYLLIFFLAALFSNIWIFFFIVCTALCYLFWHVTNHNMAEFKKTVHASATLLLILFGIYLALGGLRKRK